MSKMDRIDLSTLKKCCTGTIQARAKLAVTGELLLCAICSGKLEYRSGRWRLAQDEFAPQIGPDLIGTME